MLAEWVIMKSISICIAPRSCSWFAALHTVSPRTEESAVESVPRLKVKELVCSAAREPEQRRGLRGPRGLHGDQHRSDTVTAIWASAPARR